MYHLAGTPTGSYAKALYRYPQKSFPYKQLRDENRRRGRNQNEFELVHTGVFADNRFFDLEVEYAKASPEDLVIRLTLTNRGPDKAALHLLPTLWFRNTWSWGEDRENDGNTPALSLEDNLLVSSAVEGLGSYGLSCSERGDWLFTENETNTQRLYNQPLKQPYVKDAFHRYLTEGKVDAVNPDQKGSKAGGRPNAGTPLVASTVADFCSCLSPLDPWRRFRPDH